jgi:hypothetical protein
MIIQSRSDLLLRDEIKKTRQLRESAVREEFAITTELHLRNPLCRCEACRRSRASRRAESFGSVPQGRSRVENIVGPRTDGHRQVSKLRKNSLDLPSRAARAPIVATFPTTQAMRGPCARKIASGRVRRGSRGSPFATSSQNARLHPRWINDARMPDGAGGLIRRSTSRHRPTINRPSSRVVGSSNTSRRESFLEFGHPPTPART